MRRLVLVLALAVVAGAPDVAEARTSIAAVPLSGPLSLPTLERLGFDVTHDVTRERAIVVLHDDADRTRLAAAGFAADEVVADLEADSERARQVDARRARRAVRSSLPSGRETYRVLADYTSELQGLADTHPGVVRRVDLPRHSVQGRAIAGVEIARDVNRVDDGRPVYVVMGLHHAREWPSGEISMEFARDLAGRFDAGDARITALLDRVRVLIVPVINPDGFVMSRGDVPASPFGADQLQRKNANEVDLNRNYGAYWGGNGASVDPASDTYRGSSPWSEPESAAVHELSQRLHITNMQSIHNIASLVLRPPGFKALGLAPDERRLKDLGDRMAAATGYTSEYGYELYEVTGATEDWNYVAQNTFGYTIELGGGSSPNFQGVYQTHVVNQYVGADGVADDGDGVREALLLAGEQAGDTRDHSVIEGSAPAGAVLRLAKSFETTTSPVCIADAPSGSSECGARNPARLLADWIDTTLHVPASGRFVWHINPSTRPFERKAGRTEAWTLQCEAGGRVLQRHTLVIGIGERRTVTPCAQDAPAPAAKPTRLALSLSRTARRQRLRSILARGVVVRARCSRPCRLTATLRRRPGGPALGVRRTRLDTAGSLRFRVRLSRSGRRAVLRRAPRSLVVAVAARDTHGVTKRSRVVVRLARAR